jgi:hypothetical protein
MHSCVQNKLYSVTVAQCAPQYTQYRDSRVQEDSHALADKKGDGTDSQVAGVCTSCEDCVSLKAKATIVTGSFHPCNARGGARC